MDGEGYQEESGGQLKETPKPPEEARAEELLQEIRDNLDFAIAYEDVQRKAEKDELEFEDDMWGQMARDARGEQADDTTGRTIPAKPTISVNLLDQNIQQVVSEARQARLSLTVKPRNGLATKGTAEYLKGLVRTIQVESGSLEVRLWGLERAAKVGRGGWLIEALYANDGDFDLELRENRILDYSTVYWDPYRQRADNSDADWCLVTDWISEKERKRRWKTKPLVQPEGGWTPDDNWFAASQEKPDQKRCRIATYYKVMHQTFTLGYSPTFGNGWIGKAPEGSLLPVMPAAVAAALAGKAEGALTREVDHKTVQIYVVDGTQVLEEHPWHGQYIPVIETIGKEYFIRGKRRFKGIIANAVELLRAINVIISSATELAGTMPRTPYVGAEGQFEGHEDEWDLAAVKNYMRLEYKVVDIEGKPAPPPQRQQTELQVNGLLLLLRMMHEMFHAVTGSVAPQMRAVNPYDRSGKAIEALQRQGSAGTSNYLDNMATIAMLYEGKVLLDAIPHYYDKPGRVLRIAGEDHEDETAILLKVPFILDHEGTPIPVACPTCKGAGEVRSGIMEFYQLQACPACHGNKQATKENMPPEWQGKPVEFVDFTEGEFKAVSAIDRSFNARQEEALAGMEALAKSAPELVPSYADLWVRSMGFSGANEIADRIKSRMPEGDDDMQDIPPSLMGRFVRLKHEHQQAMQALQEAQKMLDSDAMKTAGQKDIAMIKAAVQGRLEQIKAQGKMLEVRASNSADQQLEVLRGRIAAMQQESEQQHEVLLQRMKENEAYTLQLLKELGAKEQERHSVALHDAAAAKAAERADLSATAGDVRKELQSRSADARGEASALRADARGEAAATRADARKEVSSTTKDVRSDVNAGRQHVRDESSAALEHERGEASADRQAERDDTAAEREFGRQQKLDTDEDE